MRASLQISRLILSAALALPGTAALADPLYAVTLLGGTGSSASDINRWGDVVGNITSGGVTHGFVNAGGTYTDLGTLGGTNTNANAINDYGQIVGGSDKHIPLSEMSRALATISCATDAR